MGKDMGKNISKKINQGSKKRKNAIGCDSVLSAWIAERGSQAELLKPLFEEYQRSANLDISMLIIAEQRLRNLYGG